MMGFPPELMRLTSDKEKRAAKSRVAAALRNVGVLNNLSASQRRHVVHLAFLWVRAYQFERRAEAQDQYEARSTPLKRHLVTLRSKLGALRAAIADLAEEIEKIECDPDYIGMASSVGLDFVSAVHQIAALVADLKIVTVSTTTRRRKPPRAKAVHLLRRQGDARLAVISALFEFFTVKRGLRPDAASVRIANIENTLLGRTLATSDPDSRTPNRARAILKLLDRNR